MFQGARPLHTGKICRHCGNTGIPKGGLTCRRDLTADRIGRRLPSPSRRKASRPKGVLQRALPTCRALICLAFSVLRRPDCPSNTPRSSPPASTYPPPSRLLIYRPSHLIVSMTPPSPYAAPSTRPLPPSSHLPSLSHSLRHTMLDARPPHADFLGTSSQDPSDLQDTLAELNFVRHSL